MGGGNAPPPPTPIIVGAFLMTFAAGLLDAATYMCLHSTSTHMSGKVLKIGITAGDLDSDIHVYALIVGAFLLGSAISGKMSELKKHDTRSTGAMTLKRITSFATSAGATTIITASARERDNGRPLLADSASLVAAYTHAPARALKTTRPPTHMLIFHDTVSTRRGTIHTTRAPPHPASSSRLRRVHRDAGAQDAEDGGDDHAHRRRALLRRRADARRAPHLGDLRRRAHRGAAERPDDDHDRLHAHDALHGHGDGRRAAARPGDDPRSLRVTCHAACNVTRKEMSPLRDGSVAAGLLLSEDRRSRRARDGLPMSRARGGAHQETVASQHNEGDDA